MAINNSQVAELAEELTVTTLTGSPTWDPFSDVLLFNPVIIIFDNQSLVPVSISTNASTVWRTFPAGEALVLDMRAAHGYAPNYTFSQGTQFYAQGAAGANTFSISYTYARNL